MEWALWGLGVVGAYLLGAVPFGLVVAKTFRGVDPRESGSRNIGATNVARVCGTKFGVLTLALDILKALKKTSADPEWVFPKFQGGGPVVNIQKLTARIRRRSKVKNFRPHDIRRSVASEIASMGFPRLTIAMLLNHMDRDITGTYDRHSYDREKREALEAWEHRLTEIIEGKKRSDNVVPIYSKKN